MIEAFGDRQFVANYVGGPGSAEQTAGIYISVQEFESYLYVEGGPSRVFDGYHYLVTLIEWAKTLGEVDPLDPLVLDLDGDGIETTATATTAPSFDLDLDGFDERTGWLSGDDGFLVRDLNDNGLIDDISEMFGNPLTGGFEMLSALDSNSDLFIDADDSEFGELRIWQDKDGDTLTGEDELLTLFEAGITSIDLSSQAVDETLSTGHEIAAVSSFTRSDGTTGEIAELLFDADQYNTTYGGDPEIAPWAPSLPDIKGYGLLTDLRVAASNDFRLATLVKHKLEDFTVPRLDALREAFSPVIAAWQQSEPDSRELTPVLLTTDESGVQIADYGVYRHDGTGGYWQRASGAAILDHEGNVVSRPDLSQFLAQTAADGDGWQLHEVWTQASRGASANRQPTAYLVGQRADGSQEIRDFALSNADGSWRLASGAAVVDEAGNTIEMPALEDILRQPAPEAAEWRTEKFATLDSGTVSDEVVVAWFDGQIADYAVHIDGDDVWTSAAKLNAAIRAGRELDEAHQFETIEDFIAWYPTEYHSVDRLDVIDVNTLFYSALVGGIDLDEIAALRAGRDGDGNLVYGFSHSSHARALQNVIEQGEIFQSAAALKFAAQSGLKDYFRDVPYDPQTDHFHATTDRELAPLFEQIFAHAPGDHASTLNWLEDWRGLVDIMYAQFERHKPGPMSASFVFANVVAAFESTPVNASIYEVAGAMGVPADAIRYDTADGATVSGSDGDDLFYLSTGDQILEGGAGHDAYIVGGDFGHDVIRDIEAPLSKQSTETVRFTDVLSSDITATRDGQDVILSVTGTDNSLRIVRQFEGPLPGLFGGDFSFDTGVTEIVFADGEVWNQTDLALAVRDPQPTDDIIFGTTDIDALDGGAGDDYLSGGRESDIYYFDRGYGNDVIQEKNDNILVLHNDVVWFGDGLSLADLTFSRLGKSDDLLIVVKDSTDTLTIRDQFEATTALFAGTFWLNRIEQFIFSDNTAISWDYIIRNINAGATTENDDLIYGFDYRDTLDGGAGDDYLSGGGDGDIYVFNRGYGHDVIEDNQTNLLVAAADEVHFGSGISPDDIVFERTGDDHGVTLRVAGSGDALTIRGQFDADWSLFGLNHWNRIESFVFSDGSGARWSYDYVRRQLLEQASSDGDDEIFGFEAADIIDGGAGDDLLAGGGFSDTYLFSRGYGHDTIVEDASYLFFEDFDRVVFRDLNFDDVTISRGATSLTFTITDTGESLTVADQFAWDTTFARQRFAVEEFQFADGTVKTIDDFSSEKVELAGTAAGDYLVGSEFGEQISGGRGSDTLEGGGGGDRYIYRRGDGADVIFDDAGADRHPGEDRLQFADGISPDDIAVGQDGADLLLDLGPGDSIRVRDQFASPVTRIEYFEFTDGTVWSATEIAQRLLIDLASDGNETLTGFTDEPNILDGRGGDDTLYGGNFGDTYLFGPGYGFDRIVEVSAAQTEPDAMDRVVFGAALSPRDIVWSRDGNDLLAATGAAGDELRITDGLAGAVELFDFADGTVLTLDDVKALLLSGSAGPDLLHGYDGSDDVLDGGAGSDELRGGSGSDTYLFGLGSGQDAIIDQSGSNDSIVFGPLIAPQMLRFARDDGNLLITLDGFSDNLAIAGAFSTPAGQVEEFHFSDGSVLHFDDILNSMISQSSTPLDDVVTGFARRDDFLESSMGDDVLRGASGSDTYVIRCRGTIRFCRWHGAHIGRRESSASFGQRRARPFAWL